MGRAKGAGASWDGALAQPEQSAGQEDKLVAAAEATARPGRGQQQATSSFRTREGTVISDMQWCHHFTRPGRHLSSAVLYILVINPDRRRSLRLFMMQHYQRSTYMTGLKINLNRDRLLASDKDSCSHTRMPALTYKGQL
jgi:hypothetical protein